MYTKDGNNYLTHSDIRASMPHMSLPVTLSDELLTELGFEYTADTIENPIPQTITPRQFRLQLLALGLLDEVEAMANTDKATQIWFEYSLDFQRNHEMLIASATALGLSDESMDTFFIEASKL